MLPPADAIRPLWWRYRSSTPDILDSTTDGIGTLTGFKSHANIEHDEDDAYLTTLLRSAQRMVGDYTRWPMRTGEFSIDVRYPWPLPFRGYDSRRRYRSPPGRLLLPGPSAATPVNVLACEYHGGQFDPGSAIGVLVHRSPRLPHDAWLELPEDWDYDTEIDELAIQYPISWSAVYTGDVPWPEDVALCIYRVAATMYLYREATMLEDRPLHRIMQASLGPYLPVPL